MEIYSKEEYKALEKELKKLKRTSEKKIDSLNKQIKQLKEDYAALLETACEHVTE